jgi:hypothetical protein
VSRGFEDGLFEEVLEEVFPPLVDDDRGFLDRRFDWAGEEDDEDCEEAVGDGAWACCGELALRISTQNYDWID